MKTGATLRIPALSGPFGGIGRCGLHRGMSDCEGWHPSIPINRENRVHERLDELAELLPWAAGVLLEAAGDDAHAAAENTRRLRRQLDLITRKPQNRS